MICARLAWSAPDKAEARELHMDGHKAFLRSGLLHILQSGPLFNDAGTQVGALVVAEVANAETMRAVCAEDPFITHGVYERATYLRWHVTLSQAPGGAD